MRRVKAIIMVLLMTMLVSSVAVVPAFAAGIKGEQFNLINENSGYKIIIPNLIEYKTVTVEVDDEEYDLDVIVVETPQKDATGGYPIFEIVTTDKNADSVISFPGIFDDGQIGNFEQKFKNSSLLYNPQFNTKQDLKDFSKDKVFNFDLMFRDKDSNVLLEVIDINFMFVNKGDASNTEKETPTTTEAVSAKPTASKVMVNGKEVAFEAYEIAGSNYFKLRDLAMVVNGTGKQFKVDWDGAKNAISLTTGTAYTSDGNELSVSANLAAKDAKSTSAKVYVNGEEVQFTAYEINNNNYFKLRDIAKVIDFAVTWDAQASTVGIDTSAGYME